LLQWKHNSEFCAIKTHRSGWFGGVAAYATTPPNQPEQCVLTDYFNNYNFSKLK